MHRDQNWKGGLKGRDRGKPEQEEQLSASDSSDHETVKENKLLSEDEKVRR